MFNWSAVQNNKQKATLVQMLLQTFIDYFSSTSCEQLCEHDSFIDIIVMKGGLITTGESKGFAQKCVWSLLAMQFWYNM